MKHIDRVFLSKVTEIVYGIERVTDKNKYKVIKHEKTDTKKDREKCLLIYITDPFNGIKPKHTNFFEVRKLYSILAEKYYVDVIDYRDEVNLRKMDWSHYKFIITNDGKNIFRVFKYKNKAAKVIYYATEANFLWHNVASMAAIQDLRKRLGNEKVDEFNLLPDRVTNENYKKSISSFIRVDAIWYIGNDWARTTYDVYGNIPKYRINVTAFSFHKLTESKIMGENLKGYLWFGGKGMIHKGLDLCIEAFARHPELKLYVAGYKGAYWEMYEKYLKLPNVHFVGFVDTMSKAFRNLCSMCAFSILPSCSEGSATSVLTLMNMGLIPIVSKECGINTDNKGFLVKRDVDSIDAILAYTSNMDVNEAAILSDNSRKYVANEHSLDAYEHSVRRALNEMHL